MFAANRYVPFVTVALVINGEQIILSFTSFSHDNVILSVSFVKDGTVCRRLKSGTKKLSPLQACKSEFIAAMGTTRRNCCFVVLRQLIHFDRSLVVYRIYGDNK